MPNVNPLNRRAFLSSLGGLFVSFTVIGQPSPALSDASALNNLFNEIQHLLQSPNHVEPTLIKDKFAPYLTQYMGSRILGRHYKTLTKEQKIYTRRFAAEMVADSLTRMFNGNQLPHYDVTSNPSVAYVTLNSPNGSQQLQFKVIKGSHIGDVEIDGFSMARHFRAQLEMAYRQNGGNLYEALNTLY